MRIFFDKTSGLPGTVGKQDGQRKPHESADQPIIEMSTELSRNVIDHFGRLIIDLNEGVMVIPKCKGTFQLDVLEASWRVEIIMFCAPGDGKWTEPQRKVST